MTLVLFLALIWKIIDFVRMLAGGRASRSGVVTQLGAWLTGIAVVGLGTEAEITRDLVLPGLSTSLGSLDFGSVILAGLLVSSTASAGVDLKQAIDGTDSAAKPPLRLTS